MLSKVRRKASYLDGKESWKEKTKSFLRSRQYRTLSYLKPFTHLSHDVPNEEIHLWYQAIMDTVGYTTPRHDERGALVYTPGVGFSTQLLSYLMLRRHAPLKVLEYAPWGALAVVLENSSTAKPSNATLFAEYLQAEFGDQVLSFTSDIAPRNKHVRAPWTSSMCHHNAYRTLQACATATSTQYSTYQVVNDTLRTAAVHSYPQDRTQEYELAYKVTLSCQPQYPSSKENQKVAQTVNNIREWVSWYPCPPAVLHASLQSTSGPRDLVAAQLWSSTNTPLSHAIDLASAATT